MPSFTPTPQEKRLRFPYSTLWAQGSSRTSTIDSSRHHKENLAWPRITIVTVVDGGDEYLEETIRSVVHQGYPNLEYIVVEDDSDEQRREIIRQYEEDLSWRFFPPRTSACAAINAAFAESSGEIMGWLEPGDMLHTKGLFVLGSVFSSFPKLSWITGRPFNFTPGGLPAGIKHLERWSRMRFLAGGNKYIHRDTTFWRRSLWEQAGSSLQAEYGLAAEFELFMRFFRHARLYSVDALIGGYRTHPGNHSVSDSHRRYNELCDEIADRELASLKGAYAAKLFRQLTRAVSRVPKLRSLWHKVVLRALYRCPGPDWHPKIVANRDRWVLRR
jgi:glycosyltransferase involved in cell wall biosynthesis